MLDHTLKFATNERPAAVPAVPTFPIWFGGLATPTYLDLLAVIDFARASPVYANFQVETTFTGAATNRLRFAIFVDEQADFANVLTPENPLRVARSTDYVTAGLQAGLISQIALPPLSDLARIGTNKEGRRFLTLGFEADCSVSNTDWTGGGLTAYLTHHPLPTRPIDYRAGW